MDKKTLAFLSSIKDDLDIFYYDIIGSQAHTIMLHKINILSLRDLSQILQSLEDLKKIKLADITNSSSSGVEDSSIDYSEFEDIHELVESYVISKTGIDIGGKMHTGRSRNDQVSLDLRLKIRDDILEICVLLLDLINVLGTRAKEFIDTIFPLYTHLQQAQIGTFSHYLTSYAFSLLRDFDRLFSSFDRINQSPLGACAISGTSINIDRKMTANLLGFDNIIYNSLDATTSRDVFIEFSSIISILMITISRISEDLILWSSSEFNFISLSDRHSSTSSAMPQKKNPDPLEVFRAKTSRIAGNLFSIISIVNSLSSGYSRDLQEIKPSLFEIAKNIKMILPLMTDILANITLNKKKIESISERGYSTSLDIAEKIVIQLKVPFRQSHQLVGQLVQILVSRDSDSFIDINIQDIKQILESLELTKIHPNEILNIIKEMTPIKSISEKKSLGSPNPNEQRIMISTIMSTLDEFKKHLDIKKNVIDEVMFKFNSTVEYYIQSKKSTK